MFVIPPHVVRRSRERYRQTGAHTDDSDAYVIAHLLRTDQARLQPWFPDSPRIRQLPAHVRVWLHLTQTLTRTSNRLRPVLERCWFSFTTQKLVALRFSCYGWISARGSSRRRVLLVERWSSPAFLSLCDSHVERVVIIDMYLQVNIQWSA